MRFTLKAPPSRVFPLLCPVREYDWLPGWRCTMQCSASGVAEKDAVFTTVEALGRRATWTVVTYEPDSLIEYLIVSGKNAVVRLSVSLEEDGDTTGLMWRMLFTGTSVLGRAIIRRSWSEERFGAFIAQRKAQLAHYLETGQMLK